MQHRERVTTSDKTRFILQHVVGRVCVRHLLLPLIHTKVSCGDIKVWGMFSEVQTINATDYLSHINPYKSAFKMQNFLNTFDITRCRLWREIPPTSVNNFVFKIIEHEALINKDIFLFRSYIINEYINATGFKQNIYMHSQMICKYVCNVHFCITV